MAVLGPDARSSLIEFLKDYRQSGGKLAFDSNYRPRVWNDKVAARRITMQLWSLADVALPSIDDEMALFGDADEAATLSRLSDAGVVFGALKRGLKGPVPIGEDLEQLEFATVSNVVDSTAAGDSFNAGFLYQYAVGGTLSEAVRSGHELASKVIQSSGAIIDL